jgi:hypothetical protein
MTKIFLDKPDEPEEGQHLFHSQMWVKGSMLQFIIDRGSQKNLISLEVIKWLSLPKTLHQHPYTIRWLCQGSDIHVNQQFFLSYDIKPFKDEIFVMFLPLKFVMFFWVKLIYVNVMFYMILGLTVLLLL